MFITNVTTRKYVSTFIDQCTLHPTAVKWGVEFLIKLKSESTENWDLEYDKTQSCIDKVLTKLRKSNTLDHKSLLLFVTLLKKRIHYWNTVERTFLELEYESLGYQDNGYSITVGEDVQNYIGMVYECEGLIYDSGEVLAMEDLYNSLLELLLPKLNLD